jgi:hypothetical protein
VTAGLGTFNDSHCTELGGTKSFLWMPVANGTEILDSGGLAILKSKIAGLEVHIHCLKSKSSGTINANGENKDNITYENCQFYELKNGNSTLLCAIPNIEAKLKSEIVGTLATPEVKFTPAVAPTFAVISLAGCPKTFPKEVEVKGEITCQLPNGTVSKLAHEISCTEADTGLKLGAEPAFYIGKSEVWLENDHLWHIG